MFPHLTWAENLIAWCWTTLAAGAYTAGPGVSSAVEKMPVPHQLVWGLAGGACALLLFVVTVCAVGARMVIGRPIGGPKSPIR